MSACAPSPSNGYRERHKGLIHHELPIEMLPDSTSLKELAWPLPLIARLDGIGVHTLAQFRVLLGMRDKTRSQIVTTLRRALQQKTKRPGLE